MSITGNLRFYVCRLRDEGSIGRACEKNLLDTARRIDETHKQAVDKAYADGERNGLQQARSASEDYRRGFDAGRKEGMKESGWVKLPVDADGVPIRVGDRMHNDRDAPVTVDMMVWRDGWEIVTANGARIPIVANSKIRHYNAPTIEDVLRKFYEDFDSIHGYGPDEREVVEKYADLLQIKEADE